MQLNQYARKFYADVKAFHDKFGLETPPQFTTLTGELLEFRSKFFKEELDEFMLGLKESDVAQCADALIDLLYITAGAMALQGFTEDEADAFSSMQASLDLDTFESITDDATKVLAGVSPGMPMPHIAYRMFQQLESCFNDFRSLNNGEWVEFTPAHLKLHLGFMFSVMIDTCVTSLKFMGCTTACINELWDDVQRANMSKERATSVSQSKRGSTFDVIKPKGWVPPATAAIIERYQNATV
jgi:predicted HAD superfamily Cof-like phosphohydrolase